MKIYEQRDKHFESVQAYVLLNDKMQQIGVVQFKRTAATTYAYIHHYGYRMLRGTARGFGYDTRGAALNAVCQDPNYTTDSPLYEMLQQVTYDGQWQDVLRQHNITVYQAV